LVLKGFGAETSRNDGKAPREELLDPAARRLRAIRDDGQARGGAVRRGDWHEASGKERARRPWTVRKGKP